MFSLQNCLWISRGWVRVNVALILVIYHIKRTELLISVLFLVLFFRRCWFRHSFWLWSCLAFFYQGFASRLTRGTCLLQSKTSWKALAFCLLTKAYFNNHQFLLTFCFTKILTFFLLFLTSSFLLTSLSFLTFTLSMAFLRLINQDLSIIFDSH